MTASIGINSKKWSSYQTAIFDDYSRGLGNTCIDASAGSGKSTTAIEMLNHAPKGLKGNTLLTSFSKESVEELKKREIPWYVEARTFNSLGYRAIERFRNARPTLNQQRVYRILDEILGRAPEDFVKRSSFNGFRARIKVLVDFAKATLVDSVQGLIDLADHHEIETTPPEWMRDQLTDMFKCPWEDAIAVAAVRALEACKVDDGHGIDFNDQLWLPVVLEMPLEKFSRIIVDEGQDTNPCQLALIERAATADARLFMLGDDHQCIPAGQKVLTPSGERSIESIREGDFVMSIRGPQLVSQRVVRKSETKKTSAFEFDLGNGHRFAATREHILFASIDSPNGAFVYLMYRPDMGFRIGVSRTAGHNGKHFVMRTTQEGGERLWVLRWFETYNEGAEQEAYWAYEHRIPREPFRSRTGQWCDQNATDRLFKTFGQNGRQLLLSEGFDFDRPNYFAKSWHSEARPNVAINLLLATKDHHRIEVEVPEDVGRKLGWNVSDRYTSRCGSRGTARYRHAFKSYREARDQAEKLRDITGGYIVEHISCAGSNRRMLAVPAIGVNLGMTVPFVLDGEITARAVVGRREIKVSKCYDLEVESLGNFIVNGAVVHNSIYHFRAAGIGMQPFVDRFKAKRMPLSISYRCPKSVVTEARKVAVGIEAAVDAPEGSVSSLAKDMLLYKLAIGDVVLSRTNAPLVQLFMQCLSHGTPVGMTGKDIGARLLTFVERSNAIDVSSMLEFTRKWAGDEIALRKKRNPNAKTATIDDHVACIEALCEDTQQISIVTDRIKKMLLAPPGAKVTLSTTHRFKGKEAERVYLLTDTYPVRPEYWMKFASTKKGDPQKWAETRAAQILAEDTEERNCLYVGITRSKRELIYVR
jgi:hypothetical protein